MNIKTFVFVVSVVSLLFVAQLSVLQFVPTLNANNASSSQPPYGTLSTVTLYPSGVGVPADAHLYPIGHTYNWQCVCETPADDADYVSTQLGSYWENDMYAKPTSGIAAGSTINSVTVYWRAKKIVYYGSVAGSGRPRVRTSASYDGSIVALTTSWVLNSQTWNTNPNGTSWTLAAVNAMQIGVGLDVNDIENAECRCSQVYCVIDCTLAVTGYKLNLCVKDWDLTDAISGATVTMNNGSNNVKTSNGNGWANYTSVSGTVTVSVTYYSKNVNGTSITVSADTTKNLRCKLYDVTVTAKPNNGIGVLSGVNVTVYNNTGTASGKIKSGITVDYTGQVTLTNLPNATLRFILRVKSDYTIIIANITKTISSDGQTESIAGIQNYATVNISCPLFIFIGSILSWCFNHKKGKRRG